MKKDDVKVDKNSWTGVNYKEHYIGKTLLNYYGLNTILRGKCDRILSASLFDIT